MSIKIDSEAVTTTYAGKDGCGGTYAVPRTTAGARAATRRINEFNKAFATATAEINSYPFGDEICYEYVKPNGRVIRLYVRAATDEQ